jgi:Rhs element Vgr protein
MSRSLPLVQNPDVVSLTIRVNDYELPGDIPILAVEVCTQVNRIPYARLRVADGDPAAGDFSHSTGPFFVPGNQLHIYAGYHGATDLVFSGIVVKQRIVVRQNDSWLEVECRDSVFKMTLTRRNRHFVGMTDKAVADALLEAYDLKGYITATAVTHPQLLQYQATDWDFLVSRLEANGQICVVEGGTVRSLKPSLDQVQEAEADILYGATLLELDAEFDARSQSGTVRALSWDPAEQELKGVIAAEPEWIGNGNLSASDMTGVTGRREDLLWHGGSMTADALAAWANGALLRARLSGSRGRARFQGLSTIRLGSVLQLSSLGERFNGKIYVTGVRHEFSHNDWVTDAEFGLSREQHAEQFAISHVPAAGLAPAVSGLQIGIVTQLAGDPAGEYRIRVRVPLAGMDEQGVWARVATLDAGAQRGTFFRPEVGDEVVLGFFHNDPAQPVVLGMLHSRAKAPPLEPTVENHQKAYISRSGIALFFDDNTQVVTLETPGGNRLTLTDAEGDGIMLEDRHGNKLTMDKQGIALISAKDLVLKAQAGLQGEGLNTVLKAKASLKAQGQVSAEVSSSGTLTVKGTLVKINCKE